MRLGYLCTKIDSGATPRGVRTLALLQNAPLPKLISGQLRVKRAEHLLTAVA